jgi:hypothetical protein
MNFVPIIPYIIAVIGLLLAAAAALVGAIIVFGRPKGKWPAIISFALRLLALLALVLFLLQPHIERYVKRIGDKPIALLLDVSDSMSLRDGSGEGVTRLERGIVLSADIADIINEAGGETVRFAFADGAIPLNDDLEPDELPDLLSGSTTDLGMALGDIGKPAAAVVVSDGVFDTTGDPDFPVYFVNPTSGPAADGCWLYSASAPTRILPGTRFPIDIVYRSTSGEKVSFEVYEGKHKVTSGTGVSSEGYSNAAVYANEDEPGRHFYRIVGIPGESETFATSEVIRGPIYVSYYSHNADFDSAYLRRAMASNKAIELEYYPAIGLPKKAKSPLGTDSDIIIMANPSVQYLDAAMANKIEERVAEGAGLLLLFSAAKPDAPVRAFGAIETLMPLSGRTPSKPLSGGQPGTAGSTGTAGRFGSGVVPFFTHVWDFGTVKPGSEVIWSIDGTPVLTGMRYGKGRVALLSGGGFYRWEGAHGNDDPGLDEFAADLLLYLYGDSSDGIITDSSIVELGDTVSISAFANDEPSFVISGPDGVPLQLAPAEVRPGLWQARFSPKTGGEYSLTVRRFADEGLSVNKESLLAIKPTSEMNAGFPDVGAMSSVGDGYFTGSGLSALKEELNAALLATGPETTEKRNVPLLPGWVAIGVFILLLVVEWTLRRLTGLA